MFKSIKISDWPDSNMRAWCREYIDRSHPYLVVKHLHGKKELPHFHVVCVPKEDVNHLTLDRTMSSRWSDHDDQVEDPCITKPPPETYDEKADRPIHPDRHTGKKPFQSKEKLYDADHFKYLLKPKEWNDKGLDMVLDIPYTPGKRMTSFSDEELTKLAAESAEHHEKMKSAISRLVAKLPYNADPEKFHIDALLLVLKDLEKEGKDPGPWVTHKLRAAMFKRDSRYQPYIAKKYM